MRVDLASSLTLRINTVSKLLVDAGTVSALSIMTPKSAM